MPDLIWRAGADRLNRIKNRPFPSMNKFASGLYQIWTTRLPDSSHAACPYEVLEQSDDRNDLRTFLRRVFVRSTQPEKADPLPHVSMRSLYGIGPEWQVSVEGIQAAPPLVRDVLNDCSRIEPGSSEPHDASTGRIPRTFQASDGATLSKEDLCRLSYDQLIALGQLCYNDQGFRDAVIYWTVAARKDPKIAMAFTKLGCAWEEIGDRGKAVAAYETAFGLAPQDTFLKERLSEMGRTKTGPS